MDHSTAAVPRTTVFRIQEMIRRGDLHKGELLPSQRAFAEQLNVSRSSLREALSILETIGMLRTEPRRGTLVADDSGTGLDARRWRFQRRFSAPEVYQFRFVVEGYAVRLATLHAVGRDFAWLRRNLERFKQAVRDEDLAASSRLDYEFHRRIMQLSGNRMFTAVHGTYGVVMLESQRLPLRRREQLWEPVTEHENVLRAMEKRDPDGALYFMHIHIARAAGRVGIKLADQVG